MPGWVMSGCGEDAKWRDFANTSSVIRILGILWLLRVDGIY